MIELTKEEKNAMYAAWMSAYHSLGSMQSSANALQAILTARGLMIVPVEALGPVTDHECPPPHYPSLTEGTSGNVNRILAARRAKYAPQPVDESAPKYRRPSQSISDTLVCSLCGACVPECEDSVHTKWHAQAGRK